MDEEKVAACDAHRRVEMGNQHASQGPAFERVVADEAAVDSRSWWVVAVARRPCISTV
jgi:hypothetical protein